MARGPETGALALVGLVTLYDPPRPDAENLIASLRGLGIAVKMLTGDALAVATEIARGVGLPNIRDDCTSLNDGCSCFFGTEGLNSPSLLAMGRVRSRVSRYYL